MLSISHYQKNANLNHNEVSSHASQNGCYQKVYKEYMLERVWKKVNPFTLLIGMQTSTSTMENRVLRFLQKLEIELPYDPAIPLLGISNEKTRIEGISTLFSMVAVLVCIPTNSVEPW